MNPKNKNVPVYLNSSRYVINKTNSRFFKFSGVYCYLLKLANVGEFYWSWILGDRTHTWNEKEKFICVCLFPCPPVLVYRYLPHYSLTDEAPLRWCNRALICLVRRLAKVLLFALFPPFLFINHWYIRLFSRLGRHWGIKRKIKQSVVKMNWAKLCLKIISISILFFAFFFHYSLLYLSVLLFSRRFRYARAYLAFR